MSLLPDYDRTFGDFIASLLGTQYRVPETSKAERIAERLADAASDVYVHAKCNSEWSQRRYEHSLRRVALLTYALQHP